MSSPSTTAVIAGATGLVGSCLLRRLLEEPGYERVIALTRRPLAVSHPKLQQVEATLDTLTGALSGLEAEDWYCALGTTIKKAGSQAEFRRVDYDYPMALGRQAAATGARRFLLVSAIGSSVKSKIFYSRVKGELERDLELLGIPELHLFRPSLLLGDRKEYRTVERLYGVLMKPLKPLLGKYRAVHADAVAASMIRAAVGGSGTGVHRYEGKRLSVE